MLRLNIGREARWVDMGYGVRLKLAPLTTSVMIAARADDEVALLDPGSGQEAAAIAMGRAVARRVILEWEGVGDEAGEPAPVTPAGIDALMDVWPIFDAFQTGYLTSSVLLEQEKNGSAPLPNGTSGGATSTAKRAKGSARTAREGKTGR